MAHTELSDEPCPECGASLDIKVLPPRVTDSEATEDEKATIQLERAKVCPDCGWTALL